MPGLGKLASFRKAHQLPNPIGHKLNVIQNNEFLYPQMRMLKHLWKKKHFNVLLHQNSTDDGTNDLKGFSK